MVKPKILLVGVIPALLFLFAILVVKGVGAQDLLRYASYLSFITTPDSKIKLNFELQVLDPGNAGDCKMVGDIDGDGYPDLVIGGMPDEKLNWYRYPDWKKTIITSPNTEFTTDGALGDIDQDGDLDIVVPDGQMGSNFLWYENPLPKNDPLIGDRWVKHIIGELGDLGKDVELADFDNDGLLDAAVRTTTTSLIYFQSVPDLWTKITLSSAYTGKEGLGSGDINGDKKIDLVLQGVWLRNPGDLKARVPEYWQEFSIGSAHAEFKAVVVDLNEDSSNDVIFASSEGTAPVEWWSAVNGDPTGEWKKHTILPLIERAHTLQAADMDLDGDTDVIVGQMHTSRSKEILILFNKDGQGTKWDQQIVDTVGIHNGIVADIGLDGDYDVFGSNWAGNPPVQLWVNHLELAEDWAYHQITDHHVQTFGLAFGDLNQDGRIDIASGPYWYRNPGGNIMGNWEQFPLPKNMHAILALDVDEDKLADLIAQKGEKRLTLYWLEANNATGKKWKAVKIGTVDPASHSLGAQGYLSAQLEAGGKPEVLISNGNGVTYFRIPNDPEAGNWPQVNINANPSDEGFAVGDIDRDGDLDLAATTGESKRIEWYPNPGDGSANWSALPIGVFSQAVYPDRVEMADLNGDGKLDVIVTEENGIERDADTVWWEQTENFQPGAWIPHMVTSQATTNSLDVADMNEDGSEDLVLAEHRGREELTIWLNDGQGHFTRQLISGGKESHLGAQTVDLDGDGDLDIVSIAWDDYRILHLWRNDLE